MHPDIDQNQKRKTIYCSHRLPEIEDHKHQNTATKNWCFRLYGTNRWHVKKDGEKTHLKSVYLVTRCCFFLWQSSLTVLVNYGTNKSVLSSMDKLAFAKRIIYKLCSFIARLDL